MENTKETGNSNGNGGHGPQQDGDSRAQALSPDQELVYRLKAAIDSRGRYSFRLNDMAAGLAAGQGLSAAAARRTIEEKFTAQLGQSPQESLDRHCDDRRENGRSVERDRTNERGNGYGRAR
jgi:hypothetical protein